MCNCYTNFQVKHPTETGQQYDESQAMVRPFPYRDDETTYRPEHRRCDGPRDVVAMATSDR